MREPGNNLQFKFRYVDEDGNEAGFFATKGALNDNGLLLGEDLIVIEQILVVQTHRKFISIVCLTESEAVTITMAIYKIASKDLKKALDIRMSRKWLKAHEEKLEEEGRLSALRTQECTECGASLVLTDMEVTPQVYCHFCDSIKTIDDHMDTPKDETDYCICDECGMFSKPTKFTIFYFYFLLVVYGYMHNVTYRCPACMRPEAWKMFFGNFLFVLGLPNAVIQLFRSYRSNSVGGKFKGLDTANLKILHQDVTGAVRIYSEIIQRVPYSAGIKYNLAQGLIAQGDLEHARQTLELALDDCSNYVPAFHSLCDCLEQLGDHQRLDELKRIWEVEDEEEVQNEEELAD